MIAARTRRVPRPRTPLFTGDLLSVADLHALEERGRLEAEIQTTLVANIYNGRLTDGPACAFHIPNGIPLCGLSPKQRAAVWGAMKAIGARAGAPDLVICHAGRVHLLEVKRQAGELLPSQEMLAADCRASGVTVHAGYGLADCRRILTELGVFRAGAFA